MPILGKEMKLCKSCVRCRKRKVKCDSLKPSCSTCLRGGLTCVYLPARKRGPPNTEELTQRRMVSQSFCYCCVGNIGDLCFVDGEDGGGRGGEKEDERGGFRTRF